MFYFERTNIHIFVSMNGFEAHDCLKSEKISGLSNSAVESGFSSIRPMTSFLRVSFEAFGQSASGLSSLTLT